MIRTAIIVTSLLLPVAASATETWECTTRSDLHTVVIVAESDHDKGTGRIFTYGAEQKAAYELKGLERYWMMEEAAFRITPNGFGSYGRYGRKPSSLYECHRRQ